MKFAQNLLQKIGGMNPTRGKLGPGSFITKYVNLPLHTTEVPRVTELINAFPSKRLLITGVVDIPRTCKLSFIAPASEGYSR